MQKIFLFSVLLLAAIGQLPAQCLSQPACPASPVVFCDITSNDNQLWNAPLFQDQVIGGHDLGEAPFDNLSTQITDNCNAAGLQVKFLLYLDLNQDGTMETVVSSDALPGADTVYFGNANNPNYTGGTATHFDSRPVPVEQKYGFVVEKTVTGNVVSVRLRWATAQQPGNYVVPQLPYGVGRIKWFFNSQNGEFKVCEYSFIVKDCKAPTITCVNGVSANVLPTHFIQLFATDFLASAHDNYTPDGQLKFGLRRSGTGAGFPVDGNGNPVTQVVFSCDDQGSQPVEVWAIDAGGNADYCETYVLIQDNGLYCSSDPGLIVCVNHHCNGLPVPEVNFEVTVSSNGVPPFTLYYNNTTNTDSAGCTELPANAIPLSANTTVTPTKDNNPLQGVTTLDLLLISRHILGLDPLGSPYKMIAADANKSGSITTFDVVELRKLILGIYQELPNNTSWRFVDKLFTFPNPNNPFQTTFPENKLLNSLQGNLHNEFLGIKIGDVNCTALKPEGPHPQKALSIPNLSLQTGDVVEVPVSFAETSHYLGFQFGLHFDPALLEMQQVLPISGDLTNFGVFPNAVRTSVGYFMPPPPAQTALFHLRLKALAPVHLADAITLEPFITIPPQAYPNLLNDSLVNLYLQFSTVATTEPDGVQGIFAPQPNPTTAGVSIGLQLEQSETVTVEILDGTGRLLYRRQQVQGAGTQSIEIPADALPQAGMYCWRVQAGKAFRSGKIARQ